MSKSVSLRYKVLIILLITVMTVCSVVVSLLLYQAAQQERQLNQALLSRDVTRYHQISSLLSERLTVWVESLKFVNETSIDTQSELVGALQRSADFLSLQWDVNNVWVVNGQQEVIYRQGEILPDAIRPMVSDTLRETRPVYGLHCRNLCMQVSSIPILTHSQTASVVVMSTSVQELLALLSETTQAELAMVKEIPNALSQQNRYVLNSILTEPQEQFMSEVLRAIPAGANKQKLLTAGVEVNVSNNAYLVTFVPLYSDLPNGYYLLFVHDIDARKHAYRTQNATIFLGGFGLVTAFLLSMFLLLRRYAYKLSVLSNMLPLLAQQRFSEFKAAQENSFTRNSWLSDELDTLGETAIELAQRLETLDQQATANTAKLEKMAMFDSLTGLPNRSMMMFQIHKQLAAMQRQQSGMALLFIDLDNFKKVNDSHGHHFGDEVVKLASVRLSGVIRENDNIARFGGDEFVVIVTDLDHEEQVSAVAEKLISQFVEPMHIGEHTFYISISIGIAYTENAKSSTLELMRHADTAMYEAKLSHGSAYCFFRASMNQKIINQVELEAAARVALQKQQFFLVLQPQIELATQRLTGFEALLRWRHPERGMVPPGDFLPLLENSAMMPEIDFWVLEHAIGLLAKLNERGYKGIKMAINLSAAQFANSALKPYLTQLIEQYQVRPKDIELELTETVLVADIERAIDVIHEVRALGCSIAVDDFGTGYSSLSYLRMIPSDVIKIDRSFIAGMLENDSDRNIVQSTISMVHNMAFEVVSEGIEQAEQMAELVAMGCRFGQGYFISKPIDEDQLYTVIDARVHDGYWQIE
ncbi:putative bifunctional diguanylate cyclase/phosphodiesterase [Alteromonas gilva]|uniref:EAL domain-containing protein n=1 Tax=Alteromonas gilva TaxID=2987522 RepID=A0ABT5L4Q7_9ALTE|nr:EAL domain-containing protein [Alteromonas gilva]MDC8831842.1 EAL domain-containing protein [Alteromonas gilva]